MLRSLLLYLKNTHFKDEHFEIEVVSLNKIIKLPSWIRHSRAKGKQVGKLWNLSRDLEVGRDAISRSSNSMWWSWDSGV